MFHQLFSSEVLKHPNLNDDLRQDLAKVEAVKEKDLNIDDLLLLANVCITRYSYQNSSSIQLNLPEFERRLMRLKHFSTTVEEDIFV